jgi:hypothetical protein
MNIPECEWEIEKIIDKKYHKDGNLYLIKWMNSDDLTWEPKKNLKNSQETLQQFKQQNPALVMVKDMQKELPIPKLNPQPTDYYRKVKLIFF